MLVVGMLEVGERRYFCVDEREEDAFAMAVGYHISITVRCVSVGVLD